MDIHWFENEDEFDILTRVIRASVHGGIVSRENLSVSEVEICEQGVDEGIFEKMEEITCDGHRCDKTYSPDNLPNRCVCGNEFSASREPDVTDFTTHDYPEMISEILDDRITNFEIEYSLIDGIDKLPVGELHQSVSSECPHIHVSPFLEVDSRFSVFPGYLDIFVDWYTIPELILDSEEVVEEMKKFLQLSQSNAAGEVSGTVKDVFYTGPGAPGPEYEGRNYWYTLLEKVQDKSEAHARSQEKFGKNYNDMFERFGIECLHTIFPHAMTLHCGGNHQPDGFLHLMKEKIKQSYLIESKCYSNEFKLFDEEDKGTRYTETFLRDIEEGTDFNLCGYIFFAHSFRDDRLSTDITSFVDRTKPDRNLEVICMNSQMMQKAVRQISSIYRQEPSATYRIYERSKWYKRVVQGLVDYTQNHQTNPQYFEEDFITVIEHLASNKAKPEKRLQSGFEPTPTWQELKKVADGGVNSK